MDTYVIFLGLLLLVSIFVFARARLIKRTREKLEKDIAGYDEQELRTLYEFYKSAQQLPCFRSEALWYCIFLVLENEMRKRLLIE